MTTTFAVATPHALILTVSHGLLFCQPPVIAAARVPPLLIEVSISTNPHSPTPRTRGDESPSDPHCRRYGGAERPCHARDNSILLRALPMKLPGLNLAIPVCRPMRLSLIQ
jgi:hypothetical protein